MRDQESTGGGPLAGLKVLELGQLLAGPFCASMLGYFGADVIKIEPPGRGDPLRNWRLLDEQGTSWWWHSLARNKQSVAIDLRQDEGRALVRRLIEQVDIVVENFRPGTLEKWGMGPEQYAESHPHIVFTRISGYGQDGPYAERPGFASACEAMGGLRYVNGFPGEAPVRANLSMGDTLAGLHAVIGTLLALWQRQKTGGKGQVVDASILESAFNLLEGVVPEYTGAGVVREPAGTTVTGIVPTNTYPCADGKYIVIGGNNDSIYKRLMQCAGREDLGNHTEMSDNAGRVRHQAVIDAAITHWTSGLDSAIALEQLRVAKVPSAPIYSVADMATDPHFRQRGLFEQTQRPNGEWLEVPALHPKLKATPGGSRRAAPTLGADTDPILRELLNMEETNLTELRQRGVIE
ncbi:MAG: CaiB/BaiF CoA transferase family protein [Granulosicoccaceae bacterium]